jgi:hypothetical protein
MKLYLAFILILVSYTIVFTGCSDSSVNTSSPQTETLIYEKNGLVDSIAGTCSAYIVRTIILDSIDTRDYKSLRFEMNSFTDGDLSNITLYYLKDTAVNIFSFDGSNNINNTLSHTTISPGTKSTLYLRLRLYSSVCTGQYFHLKMHNFRIYGVN